MALPLNKDGLYTVAPASNSFLASIDVQDRPDSHDLISVRVDEHQEGFAAALILNRAQRSVRQEVLFAGLPSGISLSCERLTARENITVNSVDQGFLRIVNEDFDALKGNCNGYRTVHTPGGSVRFKSPRIEGSQQRRRRDLRSSGMAQRRQSSGHCLHGYWKDCLPQSALLPGLARRGG